MTDRALPELTEIFERLFPRLAREEQDRLEAQAIMADAERRAAALAAEILAERECPPDLVEWGQAHGIPTFASVTWQAGFIAGIRAVVLARDRAWIETGK